ncbi:hypothetical protein SCLCIDRAFT_31227 [Scleroderma citrinum Foug A]|uniref:Uncharacterized protein n=1 Tax=Scleroderma citrinum Foug A TaxID=1036808 RepID=A0A0C3D0D8_9AGAM|nr:hypothetical protein SCLCIDRAFT_31227 [Scleroderma citrinum Foug A]
MESLTGKTSEEVEVPKLAENGQNWKIYHAKIVEAAATDITDLLGVLAGWEPDNGSYDWECRDAILKWTFYTSVPISILCPIQKLDTVHKIFKYLVKRFRDNEPIPRANKFQCAGTATAAEMSENYPTSANAATEQHVDAKPDEDDLTTTKALTRGTEDIDNGNVGRQDPRTKAEASAQGTSAKCTETTPVVLKSTLPHETQTKLQNSLPLTPRPPIEGEPSGCKQEVAESVVMAGRTNGTVETAEPTEIVDVDGMALLGREPAERARGIGEGDETEREAQSRLQELKLLCREIDQCSGIANGDIPITNRLLLEGEWTLYASGEMSNPNGNTDASNTAIERVDSPSESRVAKDTPRVELEGCKGGMSEGASVDEAGGNAGHGTGPTDTSNELMELVTLSIESEDPHSSGIPCVHLRGTTWRAGDANGIGDQADMSRGWMDELRGQADGLSTSNSAGTECMSHGDNAETYLSVGDAKHLVKETDGVESHVDVSTGHGDIPNVETNANSPAKAPDNVSIPQKKDKPPNLPIRTAKRPPDEPDGHRNLVDTSSVYTDTHSIGNKTERAGNKSKNIRKRQNSSKTQNSPAEDIDVYLPWNAPIEALGRMLVFGEVESGEKAIAPGFEGEGAGVGIGDRNGGAGDNAGDDDEGGTTSGGGVDSIRVKAVLLAAESQPMRQTRRTRSNDLPMSSGPPISPAECPFGPIRRRRRCGRLKTTSINVSQTLNVEMAYLEPAYIAQPPRIESKHAQATQPRGYSSVRAYGVIGPKR